MNVVIVGAGGHGRVVLDALRLAALHTAVGFIDADEARTATCVLGLPILGNINVLPRLSRQDVRGAFIAIGDNRVRRGYADAVIQSGLELINIIHPGSLLSPTATL